MRKEKIITFVKKHSNVLYYIAVFLIPGIFLIHLYNQNRTFSFLMFNHILILIAILSLISLLLYILIKLIIKSEEGALIIIFLFWVCFWLFEAMFQALGNLSFISYNAFLILLTLILLTVIVVFKLFKPPFIKVRSIFYILSLVFIFLFVFNLVPGVSYNLTIHRARVNMVNTGMEETADRNITSYIKSEFYIDPTLPKPEIHWIHLDGMLSMSTMESFFGECQMRLREELNKRGFVIYENAELNASYTPPAITALLSPAFYDDFLHYLLMDLDGMLTCETADLLTRRLAENGLTFEDNILPHHELFRALTSAGYGLFGRDSYYLWLRNHFYFGDTRSNVYFFGRWHRSSFGDLPDLLTMTTPIKNIPFFWNSRVNPKDYPHGTYTNDLPLFYWKFFFYTHAMHWWESDPKLTERTDESERRIDLYPIAYNYQVKDMLDYIDTVLDENPDAVIVLQADHGFHRAITHEYLFEQGYTRDQILELTYSIFSAVRIPPQYGGLDEPLAPLNISRELVNRFVGENYVLLPND